MSIALATPAAPAAEPRQFAHLLAISVIGFVMAQWWLTGSFSPTPYVSCTGDLASLTAPWA